MNVGSNIVNCTKNYYENYKLYANQALVRHCLFFNMSLSLLFIQIRSSCISVTFLFAKLKRDKVKLPNCRCECQ